MDGSTRLWWQLLLRDHYDRGRMRVLLWRVRWHAARTRVQHAQRRAYYRVRTLLLFWRIAVRMAQAGRSSPMAWAIILCPPLLLLWPVLWLLLHR